MSAGKTLTISSGYLRLNVTLDLTTSGTGMIVVNPGARVEFYANGKATVSGSGIVNNALRVDAVQVYALGSSDVTVSGSGQFTGTIYAPNSKLTISGGGSLVGAVVANTAFLSGGSSLHYDEWLRGSSGGRYAVVSWQEL